MVAEPAVSTVARRWGVVCAYLLIFSGCGPRTPLERAGVSLSVPEGWRGVSRPAWPVPGEPLAAWSRPGGGSLVVFTELPYPAAKAESLRTNLVTRLTNLPGLTVVSSSSETISGGIPAAQVAVTAPGDGASLAATGMGKAVEEPGKPLVPTRRIIVSVPREEDMLTFLWHAPETQAEALASEVKSFLKSVKIETFDASSSASY